MRTIDCYMVTSYIVTTLSTIPVKWTYMYKKDKIPQGRKKNPEDLGSRQGGGF